MKIAYAALVIHTRRYKINTKINENNLSLCSKVIKLSIIQVSVNVEVNLKSRSKICGVQMLFIEI